MNDDLQVFLPYPKSTISQRFGDNATAFYAGQGLKGHPAYDWVMPYGTPIPNCVANAFCYSVMHKDDPVLMDYRAAFFIVETKTGLYEISYGHMSEIIAVPGRTYQVGDIIGKIGNTGPVFVGQHEVTEMEKDAGSHDGSHLHGPQVRIITKTRSTNEYKQYLSTGGHIYFDSQGYCYGVPNYGNGYNGCVSFAPYSTETLATGYQQVQTPPVAVPAPPTAPQTVQAVDIATEAIALAPALPAAEQPWFLGVIANFLKLFIHTPPTGGAV